MPTITSGADRFLRDASAKHIPLGYEPFPKQRDFHASPAKYRLFGGAAGPGKTKALLMEAILQAHEHPGANTLLLRRTFPELEQSLLLYFRRDVPRELYKSFNESKHVVTWNNGSTTRFGYCQSESDVYQYQGAEFLFIGIDELTLFTLRQWQFLTSRNRCPIPNSFPCMAGATNPGNIGHAWVKSLWIDKQPAPGMENASEYDPADYDFVSARVSDNPVYAGDENYLKTLRALPSHLRRAFLDGNWDVFAGQYFDNFDCDRHVIRAESIRGTQVPGEGSLGDQWAPWWPRWISIDWGFEHPAATYWHCSIPAPNASTLSSRARPTAGLSQSADEGSAVSSHGDGAGPDQATPENVSFPVPHPRASCEGGSSDNYRRSDEAQSSAARVDQVEARDFSPANSGGREASSSLPKAVAEADKPKRQDCRADAKRDPSLPLVARDGDPGRIVTYREYVTRRTTPRDLAHEIVRRSSGGAGVSPANLPLSPSDPWRDAAHSSGAPRQADVIPPALTKEGNPAPTPSVGDVGEGSAFAISFENQQQIPRRPKGGLARDDSPGQRGDGREKIDAIYLSPDAFAHRTGEASIAEQMGDVFAAAGLPRPVPADDDRIGGWMLMYQMLGAGEWAITDNCFELIRTLPSLVRDPVRVEDIEKCDGDDPADAARYGLKSRYAAHRGDPGGWRSRMPLADRIAAHAYSADPTIRAMQSRKFTLDESRGRGPQRIPFRHGPHRY